MKVKSLSIQNIGMIAGETIEFNQPLIIFYGQIRQGKSTILSAVRWVTGGEFPSDIIKHGEKEASITLELDNGIISRSWYRNEKGITTARAITYIKNGKLVERPVGEIKRLLNPFLLDQDFLVKKTETERKQYFAELFAVDTTDLDSAITATDLAAKNLRAKLTGYGSIDLTPVARVDVAQIESELRSLNEQNHKAALEREKKIQSNIEHNSTVDRGIESKKTQEQLIESIKKQLAEAESKYEATIIWLKNNPKRDAVAPLTLIETSSLESRLRDAGAQNARAEQYERNVARDKDRKADQQQLEALEATLKSKRAEKISRLKTISDKIPIKDLKFDEAGQFIYQGTTAAMLSTSQLMGLSQDLSSLYPDGLGLSLIDRGESLGRSIFGFVERAQREEITILATVVGEKPATVPENIGVFIVENGKVSQ